MDYIYEFNKCQYILLLVPVTMWIKYVNFLIYCSQCVCQIITHLNIKYLRYIKHNYGRDCDFWQYKHKYLLQSRSKAYRVLYVHHNFSYSFKGNIPQNTYGTHARTHRQIHTRTHRRTHTDTHRHTCTQTHTHTHTTHTDTHTGTQTQTQTHTHRHTNTDTHRHTNTDTHTHARAHAVFMTHPVWQVVWCAQKATEYWCV